MSEPTTVVTDYALAALALALAWRIQATRPGPCAAARLWAGSFVALAVAGLVGGTWHAIPVGAAPALRPVLWSITYVAIAAADLLLVAGAVQASLSGPARLVLLGLAGVRFLAYAASFVVQRPLGGLPVQFGVTLACLLAFGIALARGREPAGRFVLGAVAVTCAGALVLGLRLAPHPQFNHNDLFHVVQMVGVWLFFRAALLLRELPAPLPAALAVPVAR